MSVFEIGTVFFSSLLYIAFHRFLFFFRILYFHIPDGSRSSYVMQYVILSVDCAHHLLSAANVCTSCPALCCNAHFSVSRFFLRLLTHVPSAVLYFLEYGLFSVYNIYVDQSAEGINGQSVQRGERVSHNSIALCVRNDITAIEYIDKWHRLSVGCGEEKKERIFKIVVLLFTSDDDNAECRFIFIFYVLK